MTHMGLWDEKLQRVVIQSCDIQFAKFLLSGLLLLFKLKLASLRTKVIVS